MKRLALSVLVTLIAGVADESLAVAAPSEASLAIGKERGSLAFWVDKAGPVAIHVTAPGPVRARLVGPRGEAASKGPAASLDLTVTATDADLAAGKAWALVVSSEGGKPLTAQVKIDGPSPALADKELNDRVEASLRSLPKVPAATPPPAPLLPDAVSVARILGAKIPGAKVSTSAIGGKIVQSSTTLAGFVPVPRPGGAKPPKPASVPNNYGGLPADPTAAQGKSFVPIASIDVADDDGSHACAPSAATPCSIKAGDVVVLTLGPGIETVGHEVHFVFFEPAHDYAVSVLEWREDAKKIAVQMPHLGPDAFDKVGAVYVGTPSGKACSAFLAFKYDPTITLFLPMDAKLFPPPATVFSHTPASARPAFGYDAPIDNATRWVSFHGGASGLSGRDTFFGGVTLKNGWLVKRVESQAWSTSALPTLQATHTVVDGKPGGAAATFSVDWAIDAASSLSYTVGLKVQGRDGTMPF